MFIVLHSLDEAEWSVGNWIFSSSFCPTETGRLVWSPYHCDMISICLLSFCEFFTFHLEGLDLLFFVSNGNVCE